MFHVVLVEPEIPPNTGNVIRLCANTGAQLHLVKPLGFPLDDAKMRRAGLDYHEFSPMKVYENWADFIERNQPDMARMFAITTHGETAFAKSRFMPGDYFVFGSETKGMAAWLHDSFTPDKRIRLPMRPHNRSLNLSNSVAVVVFEAWRQNDFSGGG
ncbi:MAG: tRNA (uridine(34)/cytosine(34)/5-carboxymethylaminomethyluridine(34)-2'-O)-methyltransferase TrmL [Burkholderiaceae bacterium]|nr:tRNA (uridine(34)/cytosine(34)/5-carboxymethylaminomethyluridine(34)-2'-O)-methyltransferase TrmL [Burkholderiaceae bacterium]